MKTKNIFRAAGVLSLIAVSMLAAHAEEAPTEKKTSSATDDAKRDLSKAEREAKRKVRRKQTGQNAKKAVDESAGSVTDDVESTADDVKPTK